MTLKEAAEKWGVTPRRINYYCAGGRIPGAVKMATIWLIPKDAEKPVDMRTKQGKVLLTTEKGKHYGMIDATDSIVKIKLNDIPYGKYKVYVYHDANGNWLLDKSADNTPVEYCATYEIDVTTDNQIFKIELVDIQKKKSKGK